MIYNAEDSNLNAYGCIQELYSDYDYRKDSVAMAVMSKLAKERKGELDNVSKYNRHPIAGAVIGGGIGYKIGAHYAKKVPLASQQRKRKIIGTVVGALIGGGIGHGIKTKRNQGSIDAEVKSIKDKYEEYRDRLFRKRRNEYEIKRNSHPWNNQSPTSP